MNDPNFRTAEILRVAAKLTPAALRRLVAIPRLKNRPSDPPSRAMICEFGDCLKLAVLSGVRIHPVERVYRCHSHAGHLDFDFRWNGKRWVRKAVRR